MCKTGVVLQGGGTPRSHPLKIGAFFRGGAGGSRPLTWLRGWAARRHPPLRLLHSLSDSCIAYTCLVYPGAIWTLASEPLKTVTTRVKLLVLKGTGEASFGLDLEFELSRDLEAYRRLPAVLCLADTSTNPTEHSFASQGLRPSRIGTPPVHLRSRTAGPAVPTMSSERAIPGGSSRITFSHRQDRTGTQP